ncbi:MAG: ParB/RepB/Spo0J family partition protein [Halobacteriovoraceae bacterium]|nr:ParB/RepB/Spo0J family partition protein [Halobacteriovoraceae bacterium]
MAKKVALGKGIASLIQDSPNEILKASLANTSSNEADQKEAKRDETEGMPHMIEVSEINTNPDQPRKIFKEKELKELSQSIAENGIIQPLVVAKGEKGFDLIAGERRLRAAKLAGLSKVPAIIKRVTDREKMVISIIENVQRSDLNCVEEALAYYQLMNEYELTQEEVAKRLGKERSTIANFLRILKLPREVIDHLQKEVLSFGHAKVLASVKERERAVRLTNEAIAENLSVRELEKRVKKKDRPSLGAKEKQIDPKLDSLKQKLERRTGYHFDIKSKKPGKGEIVIKFTNEAEFNDIFDYLLK